MILRLFIILLLALNVSCSQSSKQSTTKKVENLTNLPDWVLDPGVKNGIGGVGIAGPSKGGIKFQIPRAELDAKANIAATIKSEISRVTKNSLRSSNVNNNDDIEEFFAQASKEIIKNIPLSGVKRLNFFKSEDGTLYIHMAIQQDDYSEFLENSEKDLLKKTNSIKTGRQNIEETQKVTKELFDELEKERSN